MTEAAIDHVNEVRLVGRVSDEPIERVMPSGDVLVTWTLVVNRLGSGAGRLTVDSLECATFLSRVRRTVMRWAPGDVVEIEGAVHRRFFRSTGGPRVSRYQIEVFGARRLDRAPR